MDFLSWYSIMDRTQNYESDPERAYSQCFDEIMKTMQTPHPKSNVTLTFLPRFIKSQQLGNTVDSITSFFFKSIGLKPFQIVIIFLSKSWKTITKWPVDHIVHLRNISLRRSTTIYPKCESHPKRACELPCRDCNIFLCTDCLVSEQHNKEHKLSKTWKSFSQ